MCNLMKTLLQSLKILFVDNMYNLFITDSPPYNHVSYNFPSCSKNQRVSMILKACISTKIVTLNVSVISISSVQILL